MKFRFDSMMVSLAVSLLVLAGFIYSLYRLPGKDVYEHIRVGQEATSFQDQNVGFVKQETKRSIQIMNNDLEMELQKVSTFHQDVSTLTSQTLSQKAKVKNAIEVAEELAYRP